MKNTALTNIQTGIKFLALTLATILALTTLSGCSQRAKETTLLTEKEQTTDNKINPSLEADSSFLFDTSIFDLKENTSIIIDGQTVQVEGEVVGDVRSVDFDNDHYWITLEEEQRNKTSTITVYCTENTTNLIDTFGGYKRQGTTLQVRGTFNIACTEHDGLCDIHAESSSLKSQGAQMSSEFDFGNFAFSLVMFLFGAIMIGVYAFVAIRKKKEIQEEDEEDEDET